jgi:2-methylcitrate dehydratase PrpD
MKLTRRTLLLSTTAGLVARAARAAGAPSLTHYVSDFVVQTKFSDLPPEVLELGKKSILDGLGLALAGSGSQLGQLSGRYLDSLGLSRNDATIIGSSKKAPVRFAAFANAVGIHADDYDDTQLAVAPDRVYGLLTHPTAPCLPAALAVAESRGISGRDLLLAYHVGVEVECKIAEAIAPRHYEDGFHSTGTCGPFASAAAAAKLYGFNAEQCARALGIAASESAGLRENFGTMTKPFHAGRAAESGIVAADFAAIGWTASDEILEAPRGFFKAAGGGWDPNAIQNKLGKPWTFADPGVSIKPFPSGSLSHPAMTEMMLLIRKNDIQPGQVVGVDVGTNKNMPNALIHHKPQDALQGKFSMEFCMAVLLLYRKAGLNEFTDEVVRRPEVQSMIERVHFGVNEEAERAGYNKMTSILDIHLKDGRTISGRTDFAKGSPADQMSLDEVAAKFLDCAAFAKWPKQKATGIVESVKKLETLPDVRSLTALCRV